MVFVSLMVHGSRSYLIRAKDDVELRDQPVGWPDARDYLPRSSGAAYKE
jgi:hypothetical protein